MSSMDQRLASLHSLQTTIQSVDQLRHAVENPVKLFVMLSSLLDEWTGESGDGERDISQSSSGTGNEDDLALPVAVLNLLQDAIPLLKDDAEMLFGCVVSSVISCFCDVDLQDEVCRTLLMFTKFYQLRLFIVDEIVSHGLEHDNRNVRLMSVNIIPRVLKGLRKSKRPAFEEMFGLLLEGIIGRVRDVNDEIVQASLSALGWMWRERKDWFESKVDELGGVHEELINYYSDQIFGEALSGPPAPSSEVKKNSSETKSKSSSSSDLVYSFLPKKIAKILQRTNGVEASKVAKALKKATESFTSLKNSNTITRETVIPTLPLFTDVVLSHVTSTSNKVIILALNLMEEIAVYSPQTFSISMDVIMPFFVSILSNDNDEVINSVFRVMHRLCELLGAGLVLAHVSPTIVSSARDESPEMSRFLINASSVCCAGLLVMGQKGVDFDTGGIMSDLVVLLDYPDEKVRFVALEFYACLQHVMGANINVPSVMKSMQLLSARNTILRLERRLSFLPENLPTLNKSIGKVIFQKPSSRPALLSDSSAELHEIMANGNRYDGRGFNTSGGKNLSASPISRVSMNRHRNSGNDSVESDNDSLDSIEKMNDDKFHKLMRVQSFGEMPIQMKGIFETLELEPRRDDDAQLKQLEFSSPPDQSSGNPNGRRGSRNKGSKASKIEETLPSDSSYIPSWQSPPGSSSGKKPPAMKNLPPGFTPPSVRIRVDEYDDSSRGSDSLSPSKREDPLDVVKKRQASRRAARRALSASNADERRPRNQSEDSPSTKYDDPIHGPGTPVPVGKYKSDGSRTNIETVDVIARMDRKNNIQQQMNGGKEEMFDEDRPLRGRGNSGYNLDIIDSMLDSDGSVDYGGGGGVSSPPTKVSLATRRRQERQKKEQLRENLRSKHNGLTAADMDLDNRFDSSPVVKTKKKSKSGSPLRKKAIKNRDHFGDEGSWASAAKADIKTNIMFGGEEHVSSSLRAEAHDYLTTDDIRPSPNPQQELNRVLTKIEVEEWPEIFHTLNSVRRLALHHGNLLGSHVHSVLRSVLKAVDNLRSAVAKNAILTIGDMWLGLGRTMDPELNLVAPALLKRFADTNGFLCESADSCINIVISNASDIRCLNAFLASAGNKLPAVRAKSAAVVLRCIQRADPGKLKGSRDLVKLLGVLAQFCQDRNGETRSFGRQIAVMLIQNNIMREEKLQQALPRDVFAKIEQGMRSGLFHTPAKGGLNLTKVDGMEDDEDDIMEISGSNLNATRFNPKGGGKDVTPTKSAKVGKRERSKTSGASLGSTINHTELEGLQEIFKKMRSKDWSERRDAVTEVVDFVIKYPNKVTNSNKLVTIFDRLCEKLSDGNTKVNILALEGVGRCMEILGGAVGAVLGVLVPALVGNLARTPKLITLAKGIIENLTQSIDPKQLLQPYCNQIESATTGKSKSFMILKLSDIIPRLFQNSTSNKTAVTLVSKNVVPVALRCVGDSKPDIKLSCRTLIITLYSLMGDLLIEAVRKVNSSMVGHVES
eukprot:CAMPEP_0118642922 /NCGR_PEP_ID=MMETSP0785-20121206/6096_1 /TAXON_ID=91992 /ORGANISM="Bolidomonas pacifica, Strain CCMP 1866" /LENGTH=1505 /DNA_ID=CAMNT_0006534511 /DNA_START=76 /DNA_END=4589 /DNA_ORIENTATION=+